jgi:hypothetical protein
MNTFLFVQIPSFQVQEACTLAHLDGTVFFTVDVNLQFVGNTLSSMTSFMFLVVSDSLFVSVYPDFANSFSP